MNKRVKFFAEQVLIVFNIFIAFLLLFENKLEIPAWLQPVGRMHPLLLHFPIVLLLLAIALQWYGTASRRQAGNLFHTFSQSLLLSGALLSAVTVVIYNGINGRVQVFSSWLLLYIGRQINHGIKES